MGHASRWFWLLLALALGPSVSVQAVLPTSPGQSPNGPGGAFYPHGSFTRTVYEAYEERFVLFEPDAPRPALAPVIVFLHGWMTTDPGYSLGWIEHLCRRGWIVIFPQYQGMGEHTGRFTINAIRSVKAAFRALYGGRHVRPDRDKVAFIGHECGAVMAANLAAGARYYKIPRPGAVMVLFPSRRASISVPENPGLEVFDLSAIPVGTLLLVVTGEEEVGSEEDMAREVFYGADSLRTVDKNFLTLQTDLRGTPPLVADHLAPLSPKDPVFERDITRRRFDFIKTFPQRCLARQLRCNGIDAMDWLGTFRLFDAMANVAFWRGDRSQVFGDGEAVRAMGFWSDGRPVKGILATVRP